MGHLDFSFPLKDSILIFGVILLIILITPMLLKKLKLPNLVGLIIFGMLIGPNGLNIIAENDTIKFFGNIGLLFIMFIAGLDLDFHEFKKFRNFNILYGFLLFFLPVLLGFLIYYNFFGNDMISAMLVAIIFSTNTLISYPIVKRLNIASTMPVTSAVGAAVLADTSVLILLGFLKQFAVSGTDITIVVVVVLKFALYSALILILYPRLTRLYFKRIDVENTSQFIYIFTLLIITAVLSYLLDIEPIVGAFLIGLALNSIIPHNSLLMGRIEFTGNALFIPFFLVYVGFLIDLRVLFSEIMPWIFAILFVFISFAGKFSAAFISSKIFKINKDNRNLIFGLNLSQAGATIAIAIVVNSLGILDTNELNAVIILILVTCTVSTFIVERYGRKIAIKNADVYDIPEIYPQRILVPYSNPASINSLINLAIMFKEKNSEPIFPINIITDTQDADNIIFANNKKLANILKQAEAINITLTPATRIETSIPNGLNKAINELLITTTILGWNFKKSIDSNLYNKQLNQLLNINNSMFLACKINNIQNIKQLNLFVPENAQFEKGYKKWINLLNIFFKNFNTGINIYQANNPSQNLYNIFKNSNSKSKITHITSFDEINVDELINTNSLNIIIHTRIKGISHSVRDNYFINELITKGDDITNIILLYPEQSNALDIEEMYKHSEVMDESLISTNLSLIERLIRKIKD